MQELIIITDLGRMRVFKFRPRGDDPRENDHLIEESSTTFEGVGAPLREKVEDQGGQFGRHGVAGGEGGMSSGEEHNLAAELDRQALQRVAGAVAGAVETAGSPGWLLVAPQAILKRLTESLPPAARKALADTISADLTKVPVAKLEDRFLK